MNNVISQARRDLYLWIKAREPKTSFRWARLGERDEITPRQDAVQPKPAEVVRVFIEQHPKLAQHTAPLLEYVTDYAEAARLELAVGWETSS